MINYNKFNAALVTKPARSTYMLSTFHMKSDQKQKVALGISKVLQEELRRLQHVPASRRAVAEPGVCRPDALGAGFWSRPLFHLQGFHPEMRHR